MMSSIEQIALVIASGLLASIWEGALIVAAIWLTLRLIPALGAATRYIIWLSTLATLVLIPIFTIWHPAHTANIRSLPAIVSTQSSNAQSPRTHSQVQPRTQHPFAEVPQASLPAPTPTQGATRIMIPTYLAFALTLAWLLIAITRACMLACNLRDLRSLRHDTLLMSCEHEFPVLLSERLHVPIAVGFAHPAIILPAELIGHLSTEALESIITHETAHLRRYDVWTNALTRILECFVACNPVAWFVSRQLTLEREIACDDWVVTREGAGVSFARTLATMASTGHARPLLAAPSAIGSRNSVLVRIEQLLDAHPRHLRPSLFALGGAVMFLPIIAILLQSISPVLAYAAQPTRQPYTTTVASANGCPNNRTILMKMPFNPMAPAGHPNWYVPVTADAITAKFGASKTAAVAITVDANGKLRNISVLSHPNYPGVMNYISQTFKAVTYKPAIDNCKAVASTFHTAMTVDTPVLWSMSQVVPNYPNGWSNEHKSACKVPDLLHAGVPASQHAHFDVPVGLPQFPTSLSNVTIRKPYSASVRIHVNARGDVTSATLVSSSGQPAFDAALLAAARGQTYPLTESTGFNPVRPNTASLAWNATHGSSVYKQCSPQPTDYTWTTTYTRFFPTTIPGTTFGVVGI